METCCKKRVKNRSGDQKKQLSNRINRIIGQMNGVKSMIENDRYCDDVLIQLSAIDKAIKGLANIILNDHIHSCVVENVKEDHLEVLDEIVDLFKRFQ